MWRLLGVGGGEEEKGQEDSERSVKDDMDELGLHP